MIEVRNLIQVKNRNRKDEVRHRVHVKQSWDAITYDNENEAESHEPGLYRAWLIGAEKSDTAEFATFDKLELFSMAFMALLPDSDEQNAVIDHMDYE